MGIIYAKFDVGFPDDPKVIEAGDLAELCYVRCVLRGRDTLCDGVIHRSRLPRWLAGIRGKHAVHMAKLVEVGLLLPHPDGWQFPDHAWRRWNPLASEVDEKRAEEAERKKAYREKRRASENVPAGQSGDTLSRPDVSATPEEEKRKRREEEEKRREEETSSSSPSDSSRALRAVPDDEEEDETSAFMGWAIDHIADVRTKKRRPDKPDRYKLTVTADLMEHEYEAILHQHRKMPTLSPTQLANFYEARPELHTGASA